MQIIRFIIFFLVYCWKRFTYFSAQKHIFLHCTVQQRCTASLSDTLCFSSCPFNHFMIFVGSKMIVLFMSAEIFSSSFNQGRSANSTTSYHVAFCH